MFPMIGAPLLNTMPNVIVDVGLSTVDEGIAAFG
jgi:hypothetical protein